MDLDSEQLKLETGKLQKPSKYSLGGLVKHIIEVNRFIDIIDSATNYACNLPEYRNENNRELLATREVFAKRIESLYRELDNREKKYSKYQTP